VSRVHVIGAGLAGLSAAVRLTEAGRQVVVHEAGPAAGGRARSYFDRELGLRIDNGNHLLLSGNIAAMAYLDTIGASGTLTGPRQPLFPFIDIPSGERWTLRPNPGRLPWWIAAPSRRVPDTGLGDYLRLAAVPRITDDRTVADSLPHGVLYRRLVEPLAIAALNTPPDQGLARLLGAVLRETLMRGGGACLPRFPREGLSETLVDPAVAWIRRRGGEVRFGHRIAGLAVEAERVAALHAADGPEALALGDAVVLAVPPWVAADLLPGLAGPDEFQAILNIHFAIPAGLGEAGLGEVGRGGVGSGEARPEGAELGGAGPGQAGLGGASGGEARPGGVGSGDAGSGVAGLRESGLGEAGFIGLIGGTAEWVFIKPGHVSVTVSAANRLVDRPAETIAALVWPDVRAALDLGRQEMPRFRVVKEKRATFAATAAQERRRPVPRTALANLVLAGDWTATGLPATIEGAIRSGERAAVLLGQR